MKNVEPKIIETTNAFSIPNLNSNTIYIYPVASPSMNRESDWVAVTYSKFGFKVRQFHTTKIGALSKAMIVAANEINKLDGIPVKNITDVNNEDFEDGVLYWKEVGEFSDLYTKMYSSWMTKADGDKTITFRGDFDLCDTLSESLIRTMSKIKGEAVPYSPLYVG